MTEQATKELRSTEMMRRSLLSGFFALVATASLAAAPPVNPADAVAFMNQLWDRAVILLNNKTDAASGWRASASCSTRISIVLGLRGSFSAVTGELPATRSSRNLSKLFEDYVVFMYTARLSNFGGETMKVRGSRSDGDGVVVSTDMISPSGAAPVKVDWRLVSANGFYKINDVIVEGISMAVTQRSEFASVVQRDGGQIRGLLALMREKTASYAR